MNVRWGSPSGLLRMCGRPPRVPSRSRRAREHERPAGPADVKSGSVASSGLCDLTPDLSLFGGLYHGPWGAGTQAHSGQQSSQGRRGAGCAGGVAAWALI